MKKLMLLLSAMLLTLALVGCQADTQESATEATTQEATTQEEVSQETSEEASEETTEEVTEETATEAHYSFTDKFGKEVVIESVPETVISMSPEITEILFALGLGDQVIGRSSYGDYPAETADIPDFGSLLEINVENVLVADPDVVFVASMASEEAVTALEEQGIVVVALDKDESFEGTYEYIQEIGTIFDVEEVATSLVEDMKLRVEAVVNRVAGLEQPSVYYVVYAGDGYDSTATGDTFIHDIITMAGGDNVAKDGTGWSYSVEALVEKNPEIMFCSSLYDTKARIEGLEGYKELDAVKEGRLYEVDENIFSRQGPRIVEALEVMASILHPEQ